MSKTFKIFHFYHFKDGDNHSSSLPILLNFFARKLLTCTTRRFLWYWNFFRIETQEDPNLNISTRTKSRPRVPKRFSRNRSQAINDIVVRYASACFSTYVYITARITSSHFLLQQRNQNEDRRILHPHRLCCCLLSGEELIIEPDSQCREPLWRGPGVELVETIRWGHR